MKIGENGSEMRLGLGHMKVFGAGVESSNSGRSLRRGLFCVFEEIERNNARRRERNKTSSSFIFPCALLGINIFNLFHLTPSFHSFLPFSILNWRVSLAIPQRYLDLKQENGLLF